MQERNPNSLKTTSSLLIIAASLFYVLFGQGTHLHELDIHLGGHFDIHVHVHAHESQETEPLQPVSGPESENPTGNNNKQEQNQEHRHEVSKASDIIGTLTTAPQIKTMVRSYVVLFTEAAGWSTFQGIEDSSLLQGTSPPIPVTDCDPFSTFSLRGPPTA